MERHYRLELGQKGLLMTDEAPTLTRDELASLRAIARGLLKTVVVPDQHIQKFLRHGLITQRHLEYFLTDEGERVSGRKQY